MLYEVITVPPDLFAALLCVEARENQAGAETARAPAVLRVEGEEARVGFGKAAAAPRAGPSRREEARLSLLLPRITSYNVCYTKLLREAERELRELLVRALEFGKGVVLALPLEQRHVPARGAGIPRFV